MALYIICRALPSGLHLAHRCLPAQESQFKPIPFGFPAPPSAFTLASAPEHAAVWDHFRSIDSDKEARVLQVRPLHTLLGAAACAGSGCAVQVG
jgi:hypothetical protein